MQPVSVYEGTPAHSSEASIYTCPTGAKVKITTMIATNTTATAATVSVEKVPKGGSAGTGKMFADAVTVAANSEAHLVQADEDLVLSEGDQLYAAQGTATACNLNISGEILWHGEDG
jgi:hypothetical protein